MSCGRTCAHCTYNDERANDQRDFKCRFYVWASRKWRGSL